MNVLEIYKEVESIIDEEETKRLNVEEDGKRQYISLAQNFPVQQQEILKSIAQAGFRDVEETPDFRLYRQEIEFKGHTFRVIFHCGEGARFALLEIQWDVREAAQNLSEFVRAMNRNFNCIKMKLEEGQ